MGRKSGGEHRDPGTGREGGFEVSTAIATKVAEHLHRNGHAGCEAPADMGAHVRGLMYDPFKEEITP